MPKKLFFLLSLALLSLGLSAQTASTICLEQARYAFRAIDHDRLLSAPGQTQVDYTRKYSVRANPNESVSSRESRLYGPGQLRHSHPDGLSFTDEQEAFIYRKDQYMIYRTGSALRKESPVVTGFYDEIFDHATAMDCKYTADQSHKSVYFVVDAAGQKKYQISSFTLEFNPLDSTLTRLQVNYEAPQLLLKADYHFEKIAYEEQPTEKLGKISSYFLKEDGSLQDRFTGIKLMDYRR